MRRLELTFYHQPLQLRDGLRGVQSLWADLRAVRDGVAAVCRRGRVARLVRLFKPGPEVLQRAVGQPFLAGPAALGPLQPLAALGQWREKPEIDIHGLETARTAF